MRWRIGEVSLRVERSFGLALLVVLGCFGPCTGAALPRVAASLVLVAVLREAAQVLLLSGARPRVIFSAIGGHTTALRPISKLRAAAALLAGPAALVAFSTLVGGQLSTLARGWALISLLPIHPLPGGRIVALFAPRSVHALSGIAGVFSWLQFHDQPAPVLIWAVSIVVNLGEIVGKPLAFAQIPDDARLGAEELRRKQYARALHPLTDAFDAAPSDVSAAWLASALVHLGRLDDATRLLDDPIAGPHLFDLLMTPLFYAARYPEAARAGERSWAIKPDARIAYNLGCTYCHLDQPEVAFSWLSRALDAGWRDLHALDEDPDLAPLRARPEWQPLRARLTSLGTRT